MAKARRVWTYSPPKPPAPKVPARLKDEVKQQADQLVDTVLKPRHITPPPPDYTFNYPVDIYTTWYRHYFYFCAKYCVPGPNAVTPFFEKKFARMEYVGEEHFNLSFMRHTGEWIAIYRDLTLEECLSSIRDDPFFSP